MPVRTLIVDDERMARKRLRTLLTADADVDVVGECTNGRDAVRTIEERKPDLVFLDVQMPELDGFAVVHAVGVDRMPVTVFVTAYDQYALKAFEAHALDYLTKPFDRERFETSLGRAKHQVRLRFATASVSGGATSVAGGPSAAPDGAAASLGQPPADVNERLVALLTELEKRQQYAERLVVRSAGRVTFLRVDEIDWIEAAGNYVRLHAGRDAHLVHEGLAAVATRLDPSRFARIHRSTIVNLDRVREVQPWFHGDAIAILRDGTRLQISRTYRAALGA
ncbi:MAG TPA: LytTR family DNA-binding domain-containing protein [Gemmatimonadaceae bacterium]|nr:LytTR family DNA-binding domain-containing protein [Gemmatimonadaceae bacterium]